MMNGSPYKVGFIAHSGISLCFFLLNKCCIVLPACMSILVFSIYFTLKIHRLGRCNTLFGSNKSNYLVNFLAFLLNYNIRLVVKICYFSP